MLPQTLPVSLRFFSLQSTTNTSHSQSAPGERGKAIQKSKAQPARKGRSLLRHPRKIGAPCTLGLRTRARVGGTANGSGKPYFHQRNLHPFSPYAKQRCWCAFCSAFVRTCSRFGDFLSPFRGFERKNPCDLAGERNCEWLPAIPTEMTKILETAREGYEYRSWRCGRKLREQCRR